MSAEFQGGELVDVALKGVRIAAPRTEDGGVAEGVAIVDEHGRRSAARVAASAPPSPPTAYSTGSRTAPDGDVQPP